MKAIDQEAWVHRIIEQVKASHNVEDDYVELKSDWMTGDSFKIARRLAAHANAARGQDILWIFGIDEDSKICGVDKQEYSNWWNSVASHFDGISPTPYYICSVYEKVNVASVGFSTLRRPFVVKNPEYGKTKGVVAQREVPWREGTGTRSATRNDLIALMQPVYKLPKVEILKASLLVNVENHTKNTPNKLISYLGINFYLLPIEIERIAIPYHKCRFEVKQRKLSFSFTNVSNENYGAFRAIFNRDSVASSPRMEKFVIETGSEIIAEAPGSFKLSQRISNPEFSMLLTNRDIKLVTDIFVSPANTTVSTSVKLTPRESRNEGELKWVYDSYES